MARLQSVFLTLSFFLLLFFSQSAGKAWLAFAVFIPLFLLLSREGEEKGLELWVFLVSGVLFFCLSYPWIATFYPSGLLPGGLYYSFFRFFLPFWILRSAACKKQSISFILFTAGVLTVTEALLTRFPLPFPYGSMAFTLSESPWALQILDIVGQWGVSFLTVTVSGLIWLSALQIRSLCRAEISGAPLALTVILALWFGYGALSPVYLEKDKEIYMDLAQSAVFSTEKAEWSDEDYRRYTDRFLQRRSTESEILFFPETFFYRDVSDSRQPLSRYLHGRASSEDLVIAGGFIGWAGGDRDSRQNGYFLMDSDGSVSTSAKTILAPFGEYYPLGPLFPEWKEQFEQKGGSMFFQPGEDSPIFTYRNSQGRERKFKVLICYEAAFSSLLEGTKNSEVDFLVSASSDLWSRSYAAMKQNAAFARYRALEYRIPVVRVSNGGLSGFVSPRGHAGVPLPPFMEGNIHVRLVTHRHKLFPRGTVYSFLGHRIILAMAVYLLLQTSWWSLAMRRRGPEDSPPLCL